MKRNKFSLSNYKLLSCKQGQLLPVGLTEVLPGDTFRHHTSALVRVAPLVHPVMHPVHIAFRHFFVPARIVWADFFDKFITGGPDGEDATVAPYITAPAMTGFAVGSLADYLGLPTGAPLASKQVSAIPFRVYASIYNEYFRDKQLQDPLPLSLGNGSDTITNVTLQNVDWEKDYFTSARLEPQLGPDVTIPIGGNAPVVSDGSNPTFISPGNPAMGLRMINGNSQMFYDNNPSADSLDVDFSNSGLVADLSSVTGIPVNELRLAFAAQTAAEHRSRFGATGVEYLRYLGVPASDASLQLPEYLGGSKQTIQFSEVLGTSDDNLGELGGHGIAAARTPKYQRFFQEWGYVMTMMYVRPKTVYQNGIPRTFLRTSKEDYWMKEYEHTGQMEITNKEVFAGHTSPDGIFGYQDINDDYRRTESTVAGNFRAAGNLDDWNFARVIDSDAEATLDADFVKAVPRTDPYAAPAEDNLYCMVSHQIKARRLLSSTGWSSNLGG